MLQTDGQTSCHGIVRTMYMRHAVMTVSTHDTLWKIKVTSPLFTALLSFSYCWNKKNLSIANKWSVSCAQKVTSHMIFKGHSKLSEISTVWWRAHDLLLPFRSNYGPVLYHFSDTARDWSKINEKIYTPHLYSKSPQRVIPLKFHKDV